MVSSITLFIGWVLDMLFGDPARLPHPIVYMGRWISWWEHRLNHGKHRKCKGAVLAVSSVALTGVLAWSCIHLLTPWPWAQTVIGSIFVFFCLAGHTLRQEVRMVFEALDRSLDEGRKQVSRIVGRDTEALTAQEVRTAALETLAENLSDGVVAPLFWYALLGVPGMLAYKMVNTLDSMLGYHSPRYLDFGCWAARIDDVANYIPARLTAFSLILVGSFWRGCQRSLWTLMQWVWHYGPQHASPNSGWPESALAGILDCRFGGSHNYFGENFYKPYIGENSRHLTTADMHISIRLCLLAEVVTLTSVLLIKYIC